MVTANTFKNHPRKWDYAFMLSLATALIFSGFYIIGNEIGNHDGAAEAHPAMSKQMDRVEANQIRANIMAMDERLCNDANNIVYREELSRLISEWESLTKLIFPRELLRCA